MNGRMPSEKGYGIQTVNSCNALSEFFDVTLFFASREKKTLDFSNFYGIKKITFKTVPVYTGRLRFITNVSMLIWFFSLQIVFFMRLFFKIKDLEYDLIFVRDENSAIILEILKRIGLLNNKKVIYEAHIFKKKLRFLKKIEHIICMTSFIEKELKKYWKNTITLHDSVDFERFSKHKKIQENIIRKKFNISEDKKILTFVGKTIIYEFEKGIFPIIDAVSVLDQIVFCCIGGPEKMFKEYRKYIEEKGFDKERFIFIPHIKYSEVPLFLHSSDILISYPPDKKVFSEFVSPLKVFEYLATGKIIILSDLYTHREIIDKDSIVFVKPERPLELRERLKDVLDNIEWYNEKALKNIEVARKNSWRNRAKKIKELIS